MIDNDLPVEQWTRVSDDIRIWWGKLTDEDLRMIGGKADRLATLLQQKYAYTELAAQAQSIRWMRKHRAVQATEE